MRLVQARDQGSASECLGTPGAAPRQQRGTVEVVEAQAARLPLTSQAGAPCRPVDLQVRLEGVEPVGERPSPGRPARYSTAELLRMEQEALALVADGVGTGAATAARRYLTTHVPAHGHGG